MSQNEAFAAAAHLHVVLRRKTGRVTDTEWLVTNADYARAIAQFARERAASDDLPELLPLADRLESFLAPVAVKATPRPAVQERAADTTAVDLSSRYIGRLR